MFLIKTLVSVIYRTQNTKNECFIVYFNETSVKGLCHVIISTSNTINKTFLLNPFDDL